MGKRIEQLEQIITSRDAGFVVSDDGESLKMPCNGKNGQWICNISAPDDHPVLHLFTIIPFKVPPHKRPAVAEFITRANWHLVGCRLVLSFDKGTLCCETDRYIGEGDLEEDFVVWMIDAVVSGTDRFLPGLIRVIGSGASPAGAFADIEEGARADELASLN